MKYLSICSGLGGAELAFTPLGWECAGVCEIEPAACAVLKARFSNIPNLGDFTKIGVEDVGSIDLIVGGTPCQDFSVAGLRRGIEGERGNLTLEFIRLADRLKPKYIVWENVPGILSLDEGKTIQKVIDIFTQIGYICDIDVHDAQEFGVPQRRRRVFVTCVRLEDLLKKKTSISDRIILELLAQAWQSTWDAALPALCRVKSHLVSESQIEERAAFLQKKMDLLNTLLGASAVMRLLDYWGDPQVLFTGEHPISELTSLQSREQPTVDLKMDIGGLPNKEATKECGYKNTAVLWQNVLDAISGIQNQSTTSTLTAETMETVISSFAEALLTTLLSIVNSPTHFFRENWSSDYWNLASLLLTLTKGVTAYAGSASCELFSSHSVRDSWGHCVQLSQSITDILERHIGNWASSREILFIAEGLQRHPAPRREKGQRVAGTIKGGSGERGWPDPSDGNGGGLVDVAGTLGGGSGERGWNNSFDVSGAFVPVGPSGSGKDTFPCLCANYGDKWGLGDQEAFKGDHHVLTFDTTLVTSKTNRSNPQVGDPCHTLAKGSDAPAIAFRTNQTSALGPIHSEELTDSLAQDHPPAVAFMVENNTQASTPLLPSIRANETPNYAVAFALQGGGKTSQNSQGSTVKEDCSFTLNVTDVHGISTGMQVRRLTPTECERLQGIPDSWTKITEKSSDGPRYRMIGNGFAVPVVAWIGKRIQMVEDLSK